MDVTGMCFSGAAQQGSLRINTNGKRSMLSCFSFLQVLSNQDPVATRMVQQLGSREMQVWPAAQLLRQLPMCAATPGFKPCYVR
jgi:hypothetical protein